MKHSRAEKSPTKIRLGTALKSSTTSKQVPRTLHDLRAAADDAIIRRLEKAGADPFHLNEEGWKVLFSVVSEEFVFEGKAGHQQEGKAEKLERFAYYLRHLQELSAVPYDLLVQPLMNGEPFDGILFYLEQEIYKDTSNGAVKTRIRQMQASASCRAAWEKLTELLPRTKDKPRESYKRFRGEIASLVEQIADSMRGEPITNLCEQLRKNIEQRADAFVCSNDVYLAERLQLFEPTPQRCAEIAAAWRVRKVTVMLQG
jgi:uncharacterized protein YeeX (DUF496 family)